jgi:hypothetical protein
MSLFPEFEFVLDSYWIFIGFCIGFVFLNSFVFESCSVYM